MELSPRLYHYLVRPKWLTTLYIDNIVKERFDLNNKKILDFGCGVGTCSSMFSPDNYLGVDPDSRRIDYARRLYPKHTFLVLKEKELPLENRSVDYILVIAVLHHIPSKELQEYLQEFRRILKPNGKVIVIEPCFLKGSPLRNRFMAFFDNGKHIRDINGYFSLFYDHGYGIDIMKIYRKLFFYNELYFCARPN